MTGGKGFPVPCTIGSLSIMVLLQQLYRRLLEQPCSTSEMKNMGDSCESGNRGESGEMGEMWKSAHHLSVHRSRCWMVVGEDKIGGEPSEENLVKLVCCIVCS